MKTPRAKHLTRFMRMTLKKGSYRLSLVPLTKPVRSSYGLTDKSGTRLFPLALHQAGGVGNAPVLICFNRDFGSEVITVMDAPIAQLTTKPRSKQTQSNLTTVF